MKPRFFYTLGLWLLLPYVFFHLFWRARKQPEYLRYVGERFGRYRVRAGKPVISASVWGSKSSISISRVTTWRMSERIPESVR